ncbi:MAG: protoglobin domain-containing protein, partial [Gammaproteobacteria bacterium]|nr:protoglobin domain-containing protein [Gammaproteobacteria bacterium]
MNINSDVSAEYLLDLYGLDSQQLVRIRDYGEHHRKDIPRIVDEFYRWLATSQHFHAFFHNDETLFRVKSMQRGYWEEFLDAQIDDAYVQRRRDVGTAHARIGLPVQAYFSSLTFFLKAITHPLLVTSDTDSENIQILHAITSLAQLDASIAIETIFKHHALVFDRIAEGDYSTRYQPSSSEDLFGHAFNKMTATFTEIEHVVGSIAQGDLQVDIVVKSERDRLAKSINRMIEQTRGVASLAHSVATGDYQQEFTPRSPHDQLGQALQTMTLNLRALTAERELEIVRIKALAELSDTLRFAQNRSDFCQRVLDRLCVFLNAAVGRIYAKEINGFRRMANYADILPSDIAPTYPIGHGLVGQVAKNGSPLMQDDVPAGYMRITSGLGESAPCSLCLFPFSYNDEVILVVEIGGFKPVTKEQLEYLKSCEYRVAGSYVSITAQDRINDLFEESLRQREQLSEVNTVLEEQAEVLRQSQDTLLVQQTELEETNRALEERTRDLERQRFELLDIQTQLEEKSNQLSLTSRYKSEFLANMSHELRTPLNSLLLLAGMLAENSENNLSAEQLESVKIIHQSGIDLLELINDILDLSKIESGKVDVNVEIIDIKKVCTSLELRLRPLANDKQLALNISIAPQLDPLIATDSRRLTQILTNLIANAIKFTPAGQVDLRVRPLTEIEDKKYTESVGCDG